MVSEWIRRRDDPFSQERKDYLFPEKPIAGLESERNG